jgi:hypothetical protein
MLQGRGKARMLLKGKALGEPSAFCVGDFFHFFQLLYEVLFIHRSLERSIVAAVHKRNKNEFYRFDVSSFIINAMLQVLP